MSGRILAAVLCLFAAFGCQAKENGGLVLWHAVNGTELEALRKTAAIATEKSGIQIRLVSVPYNVFADKLTNAIPNGNGPDLFVFAHDRVGFWAEAGIVEPIEYYLEESDADRFSPPALQAMAYRDSLYGLPLVTKCIALFYRTDLIPKPPSSSDELFILGKSLRPTRHALVYDNTTLYGHAPWLHGFGGQINEGASAGELHSDAAEAALKFARRLDREEIVPRGIDSRSMSDLFSRGRVAMVISGPWFAGELDNRVPWSVTTLPIVSQTGLPAKPFLGTEGVFMSARTANKDAAFRFMNALASDDAATLRAEITRQTVANPAAFAAAGFQGDTVANAFRKQAANAVVMPSSPQVRAVWAPYENALTSVIEQNREPAAALREAEREVKKYLAEPGT